MKNRLGVLGLVLMLAGFAFVIAGGVAYAKVQDGYDSLQAFSEQQNVAADLQRERSADRPWHDRRGPTRSWRCSPRTGSTRSSRAISIPNDPLVNTASEYMYQMATIAHHTSTAPRPWC